MKNLITGILTLKIFTISLLLFFQFALISQNKKIDSLQSILKTNLHDTVRISILNQLTKEFGVNKKLKEAHHTLDIAEVTGEAALKHHSNKEVKKTIYKYLAKTYTLKALIFGKENAPDSSYRYYLKSIIYLNEINDFEGIANLLLNVGNIEYYKNNFDRAIQFYQASLDLNTIIKDDAGIGKANNCIATSLYSKGDLANALRHGLADLAIQEHIKDTSMLISSYNFIGALYNVNLEYEKAAMYMQKCIDMSKKATKEELAQMYMNLAVCQHVLDQVKSLANHKTAFNLYTELKDTNGIINSYTNLSALYSVMGEKALLSKKPVPAYFDSSIYYNNLALALIDKNDFRKLYTCYYSTARMYTGMGKHKEALNNYNTAKQLAKLIGNNEESKNATLGIYYSNKELKDYEKALFAHEEYIHLKDSVYGNDMQQQIGRLEGKFESDKKLFEQKKENEKNLAISKEKQNNQRNITIAIAILLICVFIFSVIIFSRLKVTKQQKKIIEIQQEQTELQKNEIEQQKHFIEEKNKEVIDSINYAKRIQFTLLANEHFIHENISEIFKSTEKNIFILFKPKDIVSGDFYWAGKKDNKFYLAVCDSTGHGVPGAFMSLLNVSFLNEAINEKNIFEPGRILDYTRNRLLQSLSKDGQRDGFDGIIICFDYNTGKITYAAANNSIVLIHENKIQELPYDKMPVGLGENETPFQTYQMSVTKGDKMYLYTDGYADQFGGPKGKKFKYRQLNDLLLNTSIQTPNEQKTELESTFENWRGNLEQVDDVCIIGISI